MKKRDPTVAAIERLKEQREQRRKHASQVKKAKNAEAKMQENLGTPGDVDFQRMIRDFREDHEDEAQEHADPGDFKICICVRKRPINKKEVAKKDYDAVTCLNPKVIVHACKLKVDGITKYLDNTSFQFDHTFDEYSTTEEIYEYTVQPLVQGMFLNRGRGTCFAYGQTGSGKTFTMTGVQQRAAKDIFELLEAEEFRSKQLSVHVSFLEVYGGRCSDLLHSRNKVLIRESGDGEVVAVNLERVEVQDELQLLQCIDKGNASRITHATEANETSSRSHAICAIELRDRRGNIYGKLSIIDLAGSERAADTRHHNRQRRVESAEINKSLLALKECIRALGSGSSHVPFRASKLTLLLRDSFTNPQARVTMVATVSPAASASDHTGNTLRYADRVKEKGRGGSAPPSAGGGGPALGHGGGSRAALPPKREPRKPKPKPKWVNVYDDDEEEAPEDPDANFSLRDDRKRPTTPARSFSPVRSPRRSDVAQPSDGRRTPDRGERRDRGFPAPPPGPEERAHRLATRDLQYLHETLRREGEEDEQQSGELLALHEAVDLLLEEEEQILDAHMTQIQENATLLTEEGRLLQSVQGQDVVDYDIDVYASKLEKILRKKMDMCQTMLNRVTRFREHLAAEEKASQQAAARRDRK